MAPTWKFVQVMTCKYFVSVPEFKQLQSLFSRLTLKDIKILHNKLVFLCPSYPQSWLFFWIESSLSLSEWLKSPHAARVQEIKDLFIVNLQEITKDTDMLSFLLLFGLFNLLKQLHDPSLSNTCILKVRLTIWMFVVWFITFHCESFATTSLSISKYGGMVTFYNFIY